LTATTTRQCTCSLIFMGFASVIHAQVPGRARIRIERLRNDSRAKAILENLAATHSEIQSLRTNLLTGSVLVFYSPGLDPEKIRALIEAALLSLPDREPNRDFRFIGIRKTSKRSRALVNEQQSLEPWHSKSVEEVLASWKSSNEGLTESEIHNRLRRYGPNAVPAAAPRSLFQTVLSQLKSLPVVLLLGSSALSLMTGGLTDAAIITAVVIVNVVFGTATERRAERTFQVLLTIPEPMATVIRNGRRWRIHGEEIVPGDLIVLARGHHVVADARIIRSDNLSTDNSALTGESAPQDKITEVLPDPFLPITDRTNMVYRGTLVTGGSGLAVVIATGRQTEIGRIHELIAEASQPRTPLQRQMESLSSQLLFASCAIGGLVFLIGVVRGYRALEMAKTAIALAVAVVPEGLPTVTSIGLSDGMQSMLAHKVLVRRLEAVETLGGVQVICFDKTGTLTRNRMSVLEIFASAETYSWKEDAFYIDAHPVQMAGDRTLQTISDVAVLCSEADISRDASGEVHIDGSPTETALIHMALNSGADALEIRKQYPVLRTIHRSPGRNRMLTTHRAPDGRFFIGVKGAPSEVMAMCTLQTDNGSVIPLSGADRTEILQQNRRMAASGLRVLGFAFAASDTEPGDEVTGLTWLGLVGLADPPREGLKTTLDMFRTAGVTPVMVTGDQAPTACAVARALGFGDGDGVRLLDSEQLDQMPAEDIDKILPSIDVFSRVNPSQKLNIVRAYQRRGMVVAMTGDGINDGPALKAADVGIAMGRGGTKVAREVADVVLAEDDIRAMIPAIREGRRVYSDIRKALRYILATNSSEVFVMCTTLAAGAGRAFNARQLLWLNLVTDVLPEIALAIDPAEIDLMQHPPTGTRRPILGPGEYRMLARDSLSMSLASLSTYIYGLLRSYPHARTASLAFDTLTSAQLLYAFSARSETHSIFDGEREPENPYLSKSIAGSLGAFLLSQINPAIRTMLGTTRISATDVIVCATAAFGSFIADELMKLNRRSQCYGHTEKR
jgi:Ca2+-transporting ATPase